MRLGITGDNRYSPQKPCGSVGQPIQQSRVLVVRLANPFSRGLVPFGDPCGSHAGWLSSGLIYGSPSLHTGGTVQILIQFSTQASAWRDKTPWRNLLTWFYSTGALFNSSTGAVDCGCDRIGLEPFSFLFRYYSTLQNHRVCFSLSSCRAD